MTRIGPAVRSATGPRAEVAPPRFSVCVPVYNDARWLPGAIESVLAQSYPSFELVIGDNDSTEPIAEVVAQHPDARIRYRRWAEHLPTYENFNRAIALASEPWVVPLSADDRLDVRCLEVLAHQIRTAQAAGHRLVMVVSGCRRVDERGEPADRMYYGSQSVKSVPEGIHDGAAWLAIGAAPGLAPWNIGSVAFDRSTLQEAGAFRPEIGLSADLELMLRMGAYGEVAYLAAPLLDYTVRPDSDGNVRFVQDRRGRQSTTPIGAALIGALEAHAAVRSVTRKESSDVMREVARTHLRRAGQHRLLPAGQGRRGAASDVLAALRTSPGVIASPSGLLTAIAALLAPRAIIARASAFLARRNAGAARGSRSREGSPTPLG